MSEIAAFERDPYAQKLDVSIVESAEDDRGTFVVLDDTLLYPEGGGQPADHGTLNGTRVVDVQRVERSIRHYVDPEAADVMPDGGRATLHLDWARRYDHMQQHTAQHVITAVASSRFGWETTSFHLGEERSDIELDTEPPSPKRLAELEAAVVAQVRAARPVRARRVRAAELATRQVRSRGLPEDHEGDVRLVEIEGVDLNTCGGTHVHNTAEIESVKLLGTESLRGGCRLFWVAGERVRTLLERHERRTAELRRVLETADEELVALAGKKLEQLASTERAVRVMQARLAELTAADLLRRDEVVLDAHAEPADAPFLLQISRALSDAAGSRVALLTATSGDGAWFMVVAGPECRVDLSEVGPRIAQLLEGRGGGRGSMFQGKAGSLRGRPAALELLTRAMEG